MRRISIYFLIIFCTIIKAQDDLALVKLKNGKNVKGIIVQGGEPGDYYVRIKKRNQKTVDIYMDEIEHLYRGTGSVTIQVKDTKGIPIDAPLIKAQDAGDRNGESIELQETSYDDFPIGNYHITVSKEGHFTISKKLNVSLGKKTSIDFKLLFQCNICGNPSSSLDEPCRDCIKGGRTPEIMMDKYRRFNTFKKMTVAGTSVLVITSAYLAYSSSKNYDLYKTAESDADNYRRKVEFADTHKVTSLVTSSILLALTGYFQWQEKKIQKQLRSFEQ